MEFLQKSVYHINGNLIIDFSDTIVGKHGITCRDYFEYFQNLLSRYNNVTDIYLIVGGIVYACSDVINIIRMLKIKKLHIIVSEDNNLSVHETILCMVADELIFYDNVMTTIFNVSNNYNEQKLEEAAQKLNITSMQSDCLYSDLNKEHRQITHLEKIILQQFFDSRETHMTNTSPGHSCIVL